MIKTILSLINILLFFTAFGQESIILQNPSFEDIPRIGQSPRGWYDCGFPEESKTDIQPSSSATAPFFNVIQTPSDGNTYMGMVVRDNDTWEMVAQRLSSPLFSSQSYKFSIDLCRSESYESLSRTTGTPVNYTSPVKLRIWGGNGYCSKKQLLAETPLIINTRWLTFELVFTPEENFDYILLECYYKSPVRFPYNGNLLVDNASPISPIEKEEADSIKACLNKLAIKSNNAYKRNRQDSVVYSTPDRSAPFKRRKPYTKTNPNTKPFDYDKPRNSTFSNNPNRPVKKKKDKRDPSSHDWQSNAEMPDSVKTFLKNMNVDFDNEEFSGSTKISLIYILGNMVRTKTYNTMTIGIAAKGKERERLRQPFLKFMQEFGISEERIKFKKVKSEDAGNWIGKNEWYNINIE